MEGIVVQYHHDKGYGFIRVPDSDNLVFVHINDVHSAKKLTEGTKLSFQVQVTEKGSRAIKVSVEGRQKTPAEFFAIITVVLLGLGLAISVFYFKLSWLFSYLMMINILTVGFYFYDKKAAQSDRLRVPEIVLHLMALLGGSPAAYLSQRTFRHKSVKTSFQIVFWLIVSSQVCAAVYWSMF